MKNHLRILYKALLTGAVMLMATSAFADKKETPQRDPQLDEMTFIEMINSVDLGKQSEFIQQFQYKEGKNRLLNGKYNPKGECTVENFRNKEVLLVTIPAHLLFAPNETLLNEHASEYLTPIKRYLREPDMYRVLLVMHADNTGSDQYRDEITEERVESVFEWFENSGADTTYLFPYAMSDDMPLRPNDSLENRDRNRRLEVYLMPGKKMLEQAKKGKIEF